MADAKRRAATIAVGLVVGLCTALVACSHKKQEIMNLREYAPYRLPGNAVITGQVTHVLSTGQTLVGAGCQVALLPVTTESTAYMQKVMGGSTDNWSPDPEAVWWLEEADAQGRFRFEALPAGSYYLTCPVAWKEPDGLTRERILWAETTVGPGDHVEVTVSR